MNVVGTTGNLQERNDWASGKRQTVTMQEQEFAPVTEKWERWGKLSIIKFKGFFKYNLRWTLEPLHFKTSEDNLFILCQAVWWASMYSIGSYLTVVRNPLYSPPCQVDPFGLRLLVVARGNQCPLPPTMGAQAPSLLLWPTNTDVYCLPHLY